MRKVMHLAVWLLLCGIAQPLFAAESPSRIQANYDVLKGSIMVATITETYTRTRDGYHIESISHAVGLLALIKAETIHITSAGVLTAQGLRPVSYIHERRLDTKRNARADFDWSANLITLTDRAGQRTLPLSAGTQDRLSMMFQFMFTELKNASTLSFSMTNGSKVDDYSYRVTTKQSVTVPLGTFQATHLITPLLAGKSQTEIWLAAEHANFPCKMVITEADGDNLTLVLTKVDFAP